MKYFINYQAEDKHVFVLAGAQPAEGKPIGNIELDPEQEFTDQLLKTWLTRRLPIIGFEPEVLHITHIPIG